MGWENLRQGGEETGDNSQRGINRIHSSLFKPTLLRVTQMNVNTVQVSRRIDTPRVLHLLAKVWELETASTPGELRKSRKTETQSERGL